MTAAPTYFYPDRMGRIVMEGMQEILGKAGLEALFVSTRLANPINFPEHQPHDLSFEHIGLLQTGLETVYGTRAGRGLATRIGRAAFKYGLREFGPELGLTEMGFRLLPLSKKLMIGSETLAGLFNNSTDQKVKLERDKLHIYWKIERCPLCWERQAAGPACQMAVGLLQEALYWVSGGKSFEVMEEKCIACGDTTCTIVINQTPLS
jgi:predicted hydrocarbon binding protein